MIEDLTFLISLATASSFIQVAGLHYFGVNACFGTVGQVALGLGIYLILRCRRNLLPLQLQAYPSHHQSQPAHSLATSYSRKHLSFKNH